MSDEINSFTQSVYQLDYEGLDIPTPTDADEGKVLTAKGLGESEWKNVNGSLPEISDADDGKLLGVLDGEAVWVAGRGLPDITGYDDGKILTVDDDTAVWEVNPLFSPYACYDLVFSYEGLLSAATQSNVHIVKGDLMVCEEKIAEGLPVSAMLYQFRRNPAVPRNLVMLDVYYLSYFDVDYRYIRLHSNASKDSSHGGTVEISYDEYYEIEEVSRL